MAFEQMNAVESPVSIRTFQSAATATGNGTAHYVLGLTTFVVQVQGITTATITFEVTQDETNWKAIEARNVTTNAIATTATADGIFAINVAGINQLRCRISAYTSGTITVSGAGFRGGNAEAGSVTVSGAVDTELPAAAALADNTATPTAPAVGAFGMVYDGATWDMARGDATNGTDVDVTRVPAPLSTTGGGTEATALRVTIASDSTGLVSIDDNGGSITVDQATKTNASSSALEASRVVKASAGTLFRLTAFNNNAATRYLQVFDATSAPAEGTVPSIPPVEVLAGKTVMVEYTGDGRSFSTGITVLNSSTAATKTIGGSDFLFDAQYS